MESISKEFALFIDGIRLERGLSRIDLIEGIISLSQYKRYLRGAAAIPNNIVIELANKLNYNISELYSHYTDKYSKEDNQLKQIYELIRSYEFEAANAELLRMNKDLILSSYYKTLYEYLSIFTKFQLGKVSKVHALSLFSDIIDYPNCMRKDIFTMVEVSVLDQIVSISGSMENYDPALLVYELITSDRFKYSKTGSNYVLQFIHYTLSSIFFKKNDFIKSLEISKLGVEIAISNENSNVLAHLLYMCGRNNTKLENHIESNKYLKRCFMHLLVTQKTELYDNFSRLYNQQYDTPIEELLSDITDLI